MTWAHPAQQPCSQHAQFARSMSGGCDQRHAFQQLQQLQSAASAPEAALATLGPTGHRCTRFCAFEHLFGNVYLCRSSGSHHCCDSNCDQTVRVSAACALFAMCSHLICVDLLRCSYQGTTLSHHLHRTHLSVSSDAALAALLSTRSHVWVQVDPYSSVCRLSKKVFHTPQPAARQVRLSYLSGPPAP